MGMFYRLEKKKRKELIMIFESYLSMKNFQGMVKKIDKIIFDSGFSVFSKTVNEAGYMLEKAMLKEISDKDVMGMIKKLKSPLTAGA